MKCERRDLSGELAILDPDALESGEAAVAGRAAPAAPHTSIGSGT
jgi:hypothetical protein